YRFRQVEHTVFPKCDRTGSATKFFRVTEASGSRPCRFADLFHHAFCLSLSGAGGTDEKPRNPFGGPHGAHLPYVRFSQGPVFSRQAHKTSGLLSVVIAQY